MSEPLLARVGEHDRPVVRITVDGRECEARRGDTVLTAILTSHARLRISEFGDGPRAGFCLMGACQDCWVLQEDGARLRACTTFVAEGMRLSTGTIAAAASERQP
jgi:NADH dehydrogenase/NADH:ubiquinone oxidoreductase subunit G